MEFDLHKIIRDIIITSKHHINALNFTKEYELWRGISGYKWLSKFFILIGFVLSVQFVIICLNSWQENTTDGVSLAAVGGALNSLFIEGYNLFVLGGLKYVVLILLEVVIFHFSRRTLEILTNEDVDNSFKTFLRAQIRMIGVSIYSFIMESILAVIIGLALSIIGFGLFKPLGIILIQCYFLGFAIVDNYNEIYNMTLKQSVRYAKQYAGVTLSTGIIAYFLMLLPIIGIVLGPLVGAIGATISMHQLTEKDQNMAWVFEENTN